VDFLRDNFHFFTGNFLFIFHFFCGCAKGLDFVISEAKKFGIKLVLSLVDNYEALGGKRRYVEWARSQGQPIASDDDFFTNPVVKGYYKNHIRVDFLSLLFSPSSSFNLLLDWFIWLSDWLF